MDPQIDNPQTLGAQVLRLNSPTSSWVEDQNFIPAVTNKDGTNKFGAIDALGAAHFDHDSNNNPIAPGDVLMAGFWNLHIGGLEVGQKTVTTGSVGAQGTWAIDTLEPAGLPQGSGQIRSFAPYTDSVTHREMAFAGSDPYGIFPGAFNSATNRVQWAATAEAGTTDLMGEKEGHARAMSFAACGGKLYASVYDNVLVRTDGTNPSWHTFHRYSGPALNSASSGFRGLICVSNSSGGDMLIAALEGPGDIYEFPLDGSQPTIELHTSNFLATQLGVWVGYDIAAYNNIRIYPQSGTKGCPDLLMGLSITAGSYPGAYEGWYPGASYMIRHCNGSYDFRVIALDPTLLAARALVVSQFPDDPAGTLYAGGFDGRGLPAHNTGWVYRGIPK